MNRLALPLLLAFSILTIVPTAHAQSQRYLLDLESSSIGIENQTTDSENSYVLEYGLITANAHQIQAATLTGEIKSGEQATQPVQFSLKRLNPIRAIEGGANFVALGEIQIDGKGRPVSCPIRVHFEEDHVQIEGRCELGNQILVFHLKAAGK